MTMNTTMTKVQETGGQRKKPTVTHADLKEDLEAYLDATVDARKNSERCRDYYDGRQWTEEQIKELRARRQAPSVNNRIKVKHNGLLGLVSVRKGEPKAFPRNQSDQDNGCAEAVTDALRFVADANQFDSLRTSVADNFFCEGYGGVQIIENETPRGVDVLVDHIPWDRIFFDPFSTRPDFSDARYKGFMMWMDEEDIRDTFEDVDEAALQPNQLETSNTFEDKPSWFRHTGKRRRFLVATHYFKKKNTWYVSIYTGSGFLTKPTLSPYLDEYGEPMCPIEIEHAYINRDNERYGELASFLDLQDDINHRHSKALFLLSQRQTFGTRGAIKDIKAAKRELAKPNGHLEISVGEFNKDFGILPTGDMAQGQFELLQIAKQEMDAQSYNAQLAGERQTADLSGKAIGKLQQAGVVELNKLFEHLAAWELRVYRQMWCRVKQYWTEEKWVRVTDDQDKLKFVGFNVPVKYGKFLNEIMEDESKPYAMRLGASAQVTLFEKTNPQKLEETIMVKNKPVELDVDVILDQSFDSINASQEQLDAIMQFGAQNAFDIVDLLEISNIRGKDRLIERIENRRKEAAQSGPDPQSSYFTAKAEEAAANVKVKEADAQHRVVETQLLQNQPMVPLKGSISI